MIYVGTIIKDLLIEYPELPSRTIARIAYSKYPEIFINIETARTRVRYYRGKSGKAHKKSLIRAYGKTF